MSYLVRGRNKVMCPKCAWGKVSGKWDGGIKFSCGTIEENGVTTVGRQCRQYQREAEWSMNART